MKRAHRRAVLLALAGGGLVAFASLPGAGAQGPPIPDYGRFFGLALANGTNLTPAEQSVVAFVNGQACGEGMTFIAPDDPSTPPGDVGKTVYTVDVLQDGSEAGQRPGCGASGEVVTLYLPASGRLATASFDWEPGIERVDVAFDLELVTRAVAPQLASDGVQ